jgi:hypothetical protein
MTDPETRGAANLTLVVRGMSATRAVAAAVVALVVRGAEANQVGTAADLASVVVA